MVISNKIKRYYCEKHALAVGRLKQSCGPGENNGLVFEWSQHTVMDMASLQGFFYFILAVCHMVALLYCTICYVVLCVCFVCMCVCACVLRLLRFVNCFRLVLIFSCIFCVLVMNKIQCMCVWFCVHVCSWLLQRWLFLWWIFHIFNHHPLCASSYLISLALFLFSLSPFSFSHSAATVWNPPFFLSSYYLWLKAFLHSISIPFLQPFHFYLSHPSSSLTLTLWEPEFVKVLIKSVL